MYLGLEAEVHQGEKFDPCNGEIVVVARYRCSCCGEIVKPSVCDDDEVADMLRFLRESNRRMR